MVTLSFWFRVNRCFAKSNNINQQLHGSLEYKLWIRCNATFKLQGLPNSRKKWFVRIHKMMIFFRKFGMTTSVNKSLVILVMVMASNLSSGLSLRGGASVGVEKCDPSIIPRCVKLENFIKSLSRQICIKIISGFLLECKLFACHC